MRGENHLAMMIVAKHLNCTTSSATKLRPSQSRRSLSSEVFVTPPYEPEEWNWWDCGKQVRFPSSTSDIETIILVPSRRAERNQEKQWYSAEGLDRIQARDDQQCSLAIKVKRGYRGFLDDVFLVKELKSKITRQVNLNCWCKYAGHLRGLERIVNLQHGVERSIQKTLHRRSVLLAQDVARNELKESDRAGAVARISERCSHRARAFAIAVAAADEYAVRLQNRRTQ